MGIKLILYSKYESDIAGIFFFFIKKKLMIIFQKVYNKKSLNISESRLIYMQKILLVNYSNKH